MGQTNVLVSHPGVVVDVKNNCIKVKIESTSACASCHAQSFCVSTDSASKIIDVKPDHRTFHIGDPVTVVLREERGMLAVLLAYVVPALLLIAMIVISLSITQNELVAVSLSLVVLAGYYIILFFQRHRIQRQISFSIQS